jgi:hypothetical protein
VRREYDPSDDRIARSYHTDKANKATAGLVHAIDRASNGLLVNFYNE